MCAAVPGTSLVVTLPVTVPSSVRRKLPEPEPAVFTGGASSAPLSVTPTALLPGIQAGKVFCTVAQPASTSAAIAASEPRYLFIRCLPVVTGTGHAARAVPAASRQNRPRP